jgi:hypothetical protein
MTLNNNMLQLGLDEIGSFGGFIEDLLVKGHTLRIAQMGPNFLLLDEPVAHPPANAEIVFSVDGEVERWTVHLPNGLYAGQKHVLISKL